MKELINQVAEEQGTTEQGALRDILTDLREAADELGLDWLLAVNGSEEVKDEQDELDFDTALNSFIDGVNKVKKEANLFWPTIVRIRRNGSKYIAIDNVEFDPKDIKMEGYGRVASIFCFIATQDNETKALGVVRKGDVMRPANFKAPAKYARGNIFDSANGLGGQDTQTPILWTGPEYRR